MLADLNSQEARALATQPQQMLQKVLAGLDTARGQLLTAIDRVGTGVKQAFNDSVSLLYRVGLVVTLLALLVSVFLPEVRRGTVSAKQVTEDGLRSIEV